MTSPEQESTTEYPPLVDSFGRVHSSLRISVTDACNIRCRYCMPATPAPFLGQDRLLSFEHIHRIVRILTVAGIRKVRLTGGEPLMRPNLDSLVARLASLPALNQIAMTTNGMLLPSHVEALADAGLTHINISLDTLNERTFQRIARREGIDRVIAGIDSALKTKLSIRLNALILREINMEDVYSLIDFARDRGIVIRFIEFMPLDAERNWSSKQVVTGKELIGIIESRYGSLQSSTRLDPAQPATDYHFRDGVGGIGFIDPISSPFCESCNRLRLTADGKFRNCLFGRQEWDLQSLCLENKSDQELYNTMNDCVQSKFASHGIATTHFRQPERAMYQIGG